jgi:NAD(P)-dependent dehydrogenase (short-subunit alcohol dehydrogenase family)
MNIKFDFSGRHYVVSGATSGIGRRIASDLAASGAVVLAIGRRKDRLDKLKEQFTNNIVSANLDITDFESLKKDIELFAESGKIDGSVHCAGINKYTPLRTFNWNDAEQIIKTSLYAGIEMIRLATAKKVSAEKGSHVMLASVSGIKGEIGFTAYSAAKSAVIGVIKSLALELAVKDVRVNSITPGWIPTEMSAAIDARYPGHADTIKIQHPLGVGSVEDVSNLAMFLLSDESKWITGSNIIIDGGYSIR